MCIPIVFPSTFVGSRSHTFCTIIFTILFLALIAYMTFLGIINIIAGNVFYGIWLLVLVFLGIPSLLLCVYSNHRREMARRYRLYNNEGYGGYGHEHGRSRGYGYNYNQHSMFGRNHHNHHHNNYNDNQNNYEMQNGEEIPMPSPVVTRTRNDTM